MADAYVLSLRRALERLASLLEAKRGGWLAAVEEFARSRRALGWDEDAIAEALAEDLESGGPLLGGLLSRVEQALDVTLETLGEETMRAAYEEEYGGEAADRRWMWVATLERTCPDCLERHGKVATMPEWEDAGVPNVAPTICTLRSTCRCSLVPLDVMSIADRESVTEPLRLQRERVEEYVRRRREDGVSLSMEYRLSLLGQARADETVMDRYERREAEK